MKPGIHFDVPREAYSEVPRLNWSTLKHLAQSPAHYQAALAEARADTLAFRLGGATHASILEPERFEAEYVSYLPRRAGKDWEAFEAAAIASGKTVLSVKEMEEAKALRDAVRKHRVAARYLADGNAEVTALWDIVAGDLRFEMKGRPDWICEDGTLVDVKTCVDASPDGFGRAAARLSYPAQLALYRDGLAQFVHVPKVVIIAAEKGSPNAVTVFRVPEDVLTVGREEYLTMLSRLDECRRTDTWPGYAEDEVDLTLPSWTKTYFEESSP